MDELLALFSKYGLWLVSISAFFQGSLVLIAAGFLAGTHFFHPADVWLCAAGGAWIGHLFWYWLGKSLKHPGIIRRFPRWEGTLTLTDDLIRSKPWTSIFFFQYGYGVKLLGALAFGITKLNFFWFISAQVLNCLLWAALIETLGYTFGQAIFNKTSTGWNSVFIAVTLLALFLLFHQTLKDRFDIRKRLN